MVLFVSVLNNDVQKTLSVDRLSREFIIFVDEVSVPQWPGSERLRGVQIHSPYRQLDGSIVYTTCQMAALMRAEN